MPEEARKRESEDLLSLFFFCILVMLYKHALINVGINQVKNAKTVFHFKNVTLHATGTQFMLFIILAYRKVIHTMLLM